MRPTYCCCSWHIAVVADLQLLVVVVVMDVVVVVMVVVVVVVNMRVMKTTIMTTLLLIIIMVVLTFLPIWWLVTVYIMCIFERWINDYIAFNAASRTHKLTWLPRVDGWLTALRGSQYKQWLSSAHDKWHDCLSAYTRCHNYRNVVHLSPTSDRNTTSTQVSTQTFAFIWVNITIDFPIGNHCNVSLISS